MLVIFYYLFQNMYLNLFNFTMKLQTQVGSTGDDESILQASQTLLFIFLDLIK